MVKILVLYYSMYGHVATMAKEIAKGIKEAGAEPTLMQVPETLPQEVLEKMHAPPKDAEVPVATVADLLEYDGIMFGIPTRFGSACAQMKAFWDGTGGHWGKGALAGKPTGIFFSTATLAGGQETTALTWVTQLVHHGCVFVPLGYTTPLLFNMEEVHGGSPYGAGCLAGPDGSRQPSELEKNMAIAQGTHFAKIATALAAGHAKIAAAAATAAAEKGVKAADGGEERKEDVAATPAAAAAAPEPVKAAPAVAPAPAPAAAAPAAASGSKSCACAIA